MQFKQFKILVDSNVKTMMSQPKVFATNVNKDLLWETYLTNYPVAEQQEHNCNTCRHFIKNVGGAIWLDNDLNVHTVWEGNESLSPVQQKVAQALHKLVTKAAIDHVFVTSRQHWKFGNDHNHVLVDGKTVTWEHFVCETPTAHQVSEPNIVIGRSRDKKGTLKRAFETIKESAINDVLDLIAENNLYRGEQHRGVLTQFLATLTQYQQTPDNLKDLFCWQQSTKLHDSICGIRNTSLGQLLLSISEGESLDKAVRSYENMTAPSNYRRPAGTITSAASLKKAQDTIEALGLTHSLERRHAKIDDIPVEHSLFVHRSENQPANIFDALKADIKVKPQDFKNLQPISVDEFVASVLPGSSSLEIYLDPALNNNLVTLTTGEYADAPSLFAWDNQIGWSYNNALADSDIKRRVKEAGGNVSGKLRNSLSWFNTDDLDLHLIQPKGSEIYYGNRESGYGKLDVDMNVSSPLRRDAVENIVYADTVPNGEYKLFVRNFKKRESVDVGFSVEIEFNGAVYNFAYTQLVSSDVTVAEYTIKDGEITFTGGLTPTEGASTERKLWGLNVNTFHPVNVAALSPNYWGYNKGNKHYFFFLEGAAPEGTVRPLFNEFLTQELLEHHKQVFEVLGSRLTLKDKPSLGGLGFSVGSKATFTCRVGTPTSKKLVNVTI